MATVFKKKGSPFYYSRFMVGGQDHCLSTGETDRKKARRVMTEQIQKSRAKYLLMSISMGLCAL